MLPTTHRSSWAPIALGVFLVLLGLPQVIGGAWLLSLGGSWYYLPAGIALLVRKPLRLLHMVWAYALLLVLRMCTMYLFTFEPPAGIIPLQDPVTALFYPGGVPFLKDLFFSGHTATLVLFGLAVGPGRARLALWVLAAAVGALVMAQHVHWTVDVVAAPFFAALSSRMRRNRCDLPEPAGPASTTTGAGQSGQASIRATAWRFASETTSSSREWPGRWPRSSGICRGRSETMTGYSGLPVRFRPRGVPGLTTTMSTSASSAGSG